MGMPGESRWCILTHSRYPTMLLLRSLCPHCADNLCRSLRERARNTHELFLRMYVFTSVLISLARRIDTRCESRVRSEENFPFFLFFLFSVSCIIGILHKYSCGACYCSMMNDRLSYCPPARFPRRDINFATLECLRRDKCHLKQNLLVFLSLRSNVIALAVTKFYISHIRRCFVKSREKSPVLETHVLANRDKLQIFQLKSTTFLQKVNTRWDFILSRLQQRLTEDDKRRRSVFFVAA